MALTEYFALYQPPPAPVTILSYDRGDLCNTHQTYGLPTDKILARAVFVGEGHGVQPLHKMVDPPK